MRKHAWANLAVFEHKRDADHMKDYLQQKGFESRAYNDRVMQYFLFLCPPRATWRLQVRGDKHHSVHDLVSHQEDGAKLLKRAVHCPSCGSLAINYPQMTRKFITPTILLHLGIIFRIIEHEAYCEHCHFIWHLFSRRHPRREHQAAMAQK